MFKLREHWRDLRLRRQTGDEPADLEVGGQKYVAAVVIRKYARRTFLALMLVAALLAGSIWFTYDRTATANDRTNQESVNRAYAFCTALRNGQIGDIKDAVAQAQGLIDFIAAQEKEHKQPAAAVEQTRRVGALYVKLQHDRAAVRHPLPNCSRLVPKATHTKPEKGN